MYKRQEGLSLKGDMKLKVSDSLLDLKAGINARWIEPWELNLYGNVSIIDGLIKGGITINIADDYFYGYIFASICIPDSIPLVGGKELAGVEAAVSDEFIGANIKIIGIRFGVIYYWGKNVSFGKNVDLSAPPRGENNSMSLMSSDDVTGYYGTNVHELSVEPIGMMTDGSEYKEASVNVENAQNLSLIHILPSQIRCVDSLAKPTKLAYILTKGWNGGSEANRIIVGHWANLANTRYTYTPGNYCDFTNYSNDYREPDSAAAIYWENRTVARDVYKRQI